jgi:hypothetical protein
MQDPPVNGPLHRMKLATSGLGSWQEESFYALNGRYEQPIETHLAAFRRIRQEDSTSE